MADLYVTEFDAFGVVVPLGGEAHPPLAREPAVAEQKVSFTTSTKSAAFNASTRLVRLYASIDCHVKFGADPTAAATTQKLSAGVEYWRAVTAGHKVAAYDGSS